jgi:hypothetical protein
MELLESEEEATSTVSKPIYSILPTTYATAANRLNSQKYA